MCNEIACAISKAIKLGRRRRRVKVFTHVMYLYIVQFVTVKITKELTICTIFIFYCSNVRPPYIFTPHCLCATEWVKRQTKRFCCCCCCRCGRRRRCTIQKIRVSLWVIHTVSLSRVSTHTHTLIYKAMLDFIFKFRSRQLSCVHMIVRDLQLLKWTDGKRFVIICL